MVNCIKTKGRIKASSSGRSRCIMGKDCAALTLGSNQSPSTNSLTPRPTANTPLVTSRVPRLCTIQASTVSASRGARLLQRLRVTASGISSGNSR
ncbi:hypothetical protein D3C73_922420 [compost metagenome]